MMKCTVCENQCVIAEGKTGKCGMYTVKEGTLTEKLPNQYLVTTPISIETMPMLQFQPGGKYLQISTVGCNFKCPGCISTIIVNEMDEGNGLLSTFTPDQIIELAFVEECRGIIFLMNDPLASFFTFGNVARLAKKNGLLVGCSTNGYFAQKALEDIIPYLDFVNIGLKGSKDTIYRQCGAQSVEPVFRNIKKLFEKGVHVEVSCIHSSINSCELLEVADRLGEISKTIPLQIMRYIPLEGADPELEGSILESEQLVPLLKTKLDDVYLFNSPGTKYLNSTCPKCGRVIVERDFYGPMGSKLKSYDEKSLVENKCSECGRELNFVNYDKEAFVNFSENAFDGGYPFTRALDMIEAILICIGVTDKKTIIKVWEDVLGSGKLERLHKDLQDPETYLAVVKEFGEMIGAQKQAQSLIDYMEERMSLISREVQLKPDRPTVYYSMGKPCFAIKETRMENRLVTFAGGESLNNEMNIHGRPGSTISAEYLNEANPEHIFISAFISVSVDDYLKACQENGVSVKATRNNNVHEHLSPGWDFGSPRWILGLMYIANTLHPDVFHFDMQHEVELFYLKFFGQKFNSSDVNRSFSKPSSTWEWAEW